MQPSVVIPTYNEAQTVGPVVEAVRDALAGHEYEVIVVDDDSPDETWRVVRELGYDNVRCIRREHESGLSSAVLRGFDHATGEVYAVLDADLQHPPRRVRNLVARVEDGADMALASRHADGGGVAGEWPLWRRVVSRGASALAWAAVPQARATSDPMTGLFAIRADVVDAVRERLRPRGYKIGLELLARCPVERVDEVPYTFQEREAGASNLGPEEYVRYVGHLARLTVPARRGTRTPVVQEVAIDD